MIHPVIPKLEISDQVEFNYIYTISECLQQFNYNKQT